MRTELSARGSGLGGWAEAPCWDAGVDAGPEALEADERAEDCAAGAEAVGRAI